MSSIRTLLPAIALLLAPPVATSSAAQESTFADAVRVELIEVDALVTDRSGAPVLDLAADEFRLFDNDEPVAITHFVPPVGAPPRPAESDAEEPPFVTLGSPGAPPRLVIFLDELHLTMRSRHLVFGRLEQVLTDSLPPRTEVMLASFRGSVEVVAPFTRNRKEVVKLLAERLSGASRATANQLESDSLMRQLPRYVETALAPPDPMESACAVAGGFVRGHAHQVLSRVEGTVAALGQFVRSLSAYAGPKSLLYVSDGLPLVAGQEVYDYLIEICDGSLTRSSADPTLRTLAALEPARRFPTTARLEMQELSTHDLWNALAAEANTRRVTLNTVQASGLAVSRRASVDGAPASSTTESFGRRNHQDPLIVMAEETGGRAVLNTNDVAPAVAELIALDSARYVLAFAAPAPGDGKAHRLRLEVARPDVELRYRRSYVSRAPNEAIIDGVLASLHHGFVDNTHDLQVAARRLPDSKVALEVRVPLSSLVLLPEGDESRGLFTIFVSALDSSGVGTGIRQKSIALRSSPEEGPRSHTVETVLDLEKSRHYVVAVAVRDELGATTSFTTTAVRAQ